MEARRTPCPSLISPAFLPPSLPFPPVLAPAANCSISPRGRLRTGKRIETQSKTSSTFSPLSPPLQTDSIVGPKHKGKNRFSFWPSLPPPSGQTATNNRAQIGRRRWLNQEIALPIQREEIEGKASSHPPFSRLLCDVFAFLFLPRPSPGEKTVISLS